MASVTQTVGTVLGTVNTVASTVARTVNTVASGLDMLDAYVQRALKEQLINDEALRDTIEDRVQEHTVLETARRHADLERTLNSDQALAKFYKLAHERYVNETAPRIQAKLAALDNRLTSG